MGAHPANDRLELLDIDRPARAAGYRQLIMRPDHDIAVRDECLGDPLSIPRLVVFSPPPPMDRDEYRTTTRRDRAFRMINIEPLTGASRRRISNVSNLDPRAPPNRR